MSFNGRTLNGFTLNGRVVMTQTWANLLGTNPSNTGDVTPTFSTGVSRGAIHAAKSRHFMQYRRNEIDDQEYQQLIKKDEFLALRLIINKTEHRIDRVVQYNEPERTVTISGINTKGPKIEISNVNIRKVT